MPMALLILDLPELSVMCCPRLPGLCAPAEFRPSAQCLKQSTNQKPLRGSHTPGCSCVPAVSLPPQQGFQCGGQDFS